MPKTISRREMLRSAIAGAAVIGLSRDVAADEKKDKKQTAPKSDKPKERKVPTFKNGMFYDADKKFDVEKAKDAIIRLCQFHRYPIFPGFRDKLWVFDYGIGQFTKVGLACYTFVNHVAGPNSYMLSNLFLLPGQMLPEHWHEVPETKNCPQKDEGWAIQWGRSYVIGEGEPNLPPEVVVPKCHWGGKVSVNHCTVADPGTFVPLARVGSRHWQFAGPEGVILTEVANAHDDKAVRHSDPVANKAVLG